MDPQPGPSDGPQPLWPAAALSGMLALLWLWPALSCGFLNDDFLLGYYLDQGAVDLHVDWERVWGEFSGPFFGVPFLYRPLVTLSMAGNAALGGADPFGFHLWNLLLAAGAAVGTGILCALHAARARAPAALLGAALVVLHPAAVEPACWISGRTSTQAVCFAVLCMAAFAARQRGRLRGPWLEVLCALLALGSREEAVMLPVSLLALDLLHRPRRDLLERVRMLLPVALAVLGYLVVRLWALGGLAPGGGGATQLSGAAANLLRRGGQVFWPQGAGTVQVVTGALFLAALALAALRRPRIVVLGALWGLVVFAPAAGIAARQEAMGGRFTWAGLPVLAVVVVALAWGQGSGRARRAVLVVTAAVAALSWAPLSHRLLGHYRRAATEIEQMQTGLLELGRDVEPTRPLAITALRTVNPLRLVHGKAFFPLVEKPFAPRDVPVVGLGFVLDPDGNDPELFRDPSAVYAFAEIGSPIASWDARAGGVRARKWPERREVALLRVPGQSAAFGADGLAPLSFEQVWVRVSGSAEGASLEWWTEPALPEEFATVPWAWTEDDGNQTVFTFDVTRTLAALLVDELGIELRGLRVQGVAPERITEVRVLPRARFLDPGTALDGRELTLEEAAAILRAPPDAGIGGIRLVVVGPTSGWSMPVLPGAPLRLTEGILGEIAYARDVARQQRFYYFFQSAAARSPLDWFQLGDRR